jgi:S-formylglutathione hydrolase FrmB
MIELCPPKFLTLLFLLHTLLSSARTDTVSVYSPSMQKYSSCLVILPETYSDEQKEFPVLYLLHGYGGNFLSWLNLDKDLPRKASQYNMIIVCPDGGVRSWYIDSPIDSAMRYETHVIHEVVPWIDSIYRTVEDRSARAISGLSMGGHGGLYLGTRHTALFGAAGSTSGGVDIRQFTASWDLKEKILGDTVYFKSNWENHTVYNVINKLQPEELAIIVDCGLDDFFLEVNRKLHAKLLSKNILHDYTERPGGHNSEYWLNSIDYHLLFFSKFFQSSTYLSRKVDKQ